MSATDACPSCSRAHGEQDLTVSIHEAKALASVNLLGRDGVFGVGMKPRQRKNDSGDRIRIYVESPETASLIPDNIAGFKTEPVVTGRIKAKAFAPDVPFNVRAAVGSTISQHTRKYRPVPGGVSISNSKQVLAGTMACVVYDKKTKTKLALSNAHVFSNSNEFVAGTPIVQPGEYDGGRLPSDQVGTLYKDAKITFNDNNAENYIDAALCLPEDPDIFSDEILDIGFIKGVEKAEVGMNVMKSGRTTGLNFGVIKDVSATIVVDYGSEGFAVFTDQIIVEPPMVQAGDSGSLLINTDTKKAVGLVFAGSDTVAIANKIETVLGAFGVEFKIINEQTGKAEFIGEEVIFHNVFSTATLIVAGLAAVGAIAIVSKLVR